MKKVPPVRMRREEKTPPSMERTTESNHSSLISGTDRRKYEDAVIAEAVKFTATRFMGRGVYDTREAATLLEAMNQAEAIARDAGDKDVGRVLIYAINEAGRQVLVMAGGKMVTT